MKLMRSNPTKKMGVKKFSPNLRLNQFKASNLVKSRSLIQSSKKHFHTSPKLQFCKHDEKYPHHLNTDFTSTLNLHTPHEILPTYRVMNSRGEIVKKGEDNRFKLASDPTLLKKMYRTMVTVNHMDTVMYNVQRQGRISFYMTSFGEEASTVSSAAALDLGDPIYAQYREAGGLLFRGFTVEQAMHQCYSNQEDKGKGRQMPVHYGSKEFNWHTISSPLATQIPQAAGAAYALKMEKSPNCVLCYFGEGAASEGDFHAAMNFATTLETPTIFFCRNNSYAISTPVQDQYRGDGIASRAAGYGMGAIRFDGNDVFAVYNATKMAREYVLSENKPLLLEAVTYRMGHHSTSDDSSAYRTAGELELWQDLSPIVRLKKYLINHSIWSEEEDEELHKSAKTEVLNKMKLAEKTAKPPIEDLFTDVYDQVPPHLQAQRRELFDHLERYKEFYPIDKHA